MYLHIGNNKSIKKKTLIGIFDIESSSRSAVTKEFLKAQQKKGAVENISPDLPKSIVLTDEKTFLSPTAVRSFRNR